MFALGLMSWLYARPTEGPHRRPREEVGEAARDRRSKYPRFKAGYAFGGTAEGFATRYEVAPAELAPGTYQNIKGNQALAPGLVAAGCSGSCRSF